MIDLMENFTSFEKLASKMGLVINQEERSRRKENSHELLSLGLYVFRKVENFRYLGSYINRENNRMVEMKKKTFNYG
jgi:hypothetical protein